MRTDPRAAAGPCADGEVWTGPGTVTSAFDGTTYSAPRTAPSGGHCGHLDHSTRLASGCLPDVAFSQAGRSRTSPPSLCHLLLRLSRFHCPPPAASLSHAALSLLCHSPKAIHLPAPPCISGYQPPSNVLPLPSGPPWPSRLALTPRSRPSAFPSPFALPTLRPRLLRPSSQVFRQGF